MTVELTTTLQSNKQSDASQPQKHAVKMKDIKKYHEVYNDYTNTADLHNRILYSFGDPSSMAQVIQDTSKRTGMTKDEIFKDVFNRMNNIFNKLKASNIIVVEGTKLTEIKVIKADNYLRIKDAFMDLAHRPEMFETVEFNSESQTLDTIAPSHEIEVRLADFDHIVNDIVPEILKEKTLVLDDITHIEKLLKDEVAQALILDKLEEENDKAGKHQSKPEGDEYQLTPEQITLSNAVKIAEKINNTFDITIAGKVPGISRTEKPAPEDYHEKSMLGLKQTPKNSHESEYLKQVTKGVKGINLRSTIIATPKNCSSDIIEKVKYLNKDYLYIEDWLYKYSLGDEVTKKQVIKDLSTVSKNLSEEEITRITRDIDDYLQNYIEVYDIKNPQNNEKLEGLMKKYSSSVAMSEVSRGYFLGVSRDAKNLVKLFVGVAALCEILKKTFRALDPAVLVITVESLVNNSTDIYDACQNYLTWKQQFGDKEAKKMFENTVSHVLTAAGPTFALDIIEYGSPLKNIAVRNASCASTYAESITTFKKYYEQLENLINKGIKKVPEEVKKDPEKQRLWKMTEAWKAFSAHSLNRGEVAGIVLSQPFALASTILCNMAYPVGAGGLFILFDQTFESVITNLYLALDSTNWNKFKNRFKKLLVKNPEIKPEEYIALKKAATTKIVETDFGQKSLASSLKIADHMPKKALRKIKDVYMSFFKVINNTIGKVVSTVCLKKMDKKYERIMIEKEQEKARKISQGA